MRKFKFVSGQVMAVTASLLLVAACGGGGGDDLVDEITGDTTTTTSAETTTSSSTTTSVASTTTTTILAASARLNNIGRGFCVVENGANEVVAANVCFANVANENWRLIGYADDKVAIQNVGTERCIAVDSPAATPEGGNAVTVPCDGSPATLYTRPASTTVAEGFNLKNDASTQCLEIMNANNTPGGQVTQWTCGTEVQHQIWTAAVNP